MLTPTRAKERFYISMTINEDEEEEENKTDEGEKDSDGGEGWPRG